MRMLMMGAALVMVTSAAMADDDDAKGAQKLAMQGRDDYWHCLAREYARDGNQGLSEQDFGRSVAGACPSERQYYRVALLDYLTTHIRILMPAPIPAPRTGPLERRRRTS